ncbi:MAG TPA: filamentous hemagglutinin N-terminal domain-containing protein [Nitrospirales bacterium]|nr:hypothetical protein [Nitrospiraceae bacterium]HNP30923.1 filamentous hemagglutinin N-terminal domain-containing protein [Nitrospirales bacterium]
MKIWPSVSLGLFIFLLGGVIYGQTPPPITSSGLNTQISAPVNLPGGAVQHNITGGTRPAGGGNLFHSFGEFGVPTNNIANFLNDAALPTTNILSRVTGGNPSNIFGTIQTQGFGNANLFLMNPAGIVFGPNASLNVGGAAHFTTADYLRLADGVQFTALPSDQDALLSVAPVAAFGFLESNPASILVDGSTLSVEEGQTISLVGGDITIGSGLNALGGKIALASVASPGEVLADTYDSAPNVNGQSFTTMGNIVLSEGATLNVSGDPTGGDAAGTFMIRGGQLMMTDASVSADTVDADGAPLAVDIQLTGDLTMTDTQGSPMITARTTGSGNAGAVDITSENLNATSNSLEQFFALIDTHTSGSGTGGDVNIATRDTIQAIGKNEGQMFFIDSGTIGEEGGHGGNVVIETDQLLLTDADISTGDWIAQNLDTSTGSGGNLSIAADTIQLTSTFLVTDGFNAGKAGDINITANDIQVADGSAIRLAEDGGGGAITINTNSLSLDFSRIDGETVFGIGDGVPWTAVTINANVVTLRNGALIRYQTYGDGAAGDIRVMATDRMILTDVVEGLTPSGLYTNSVGSEFSRVEGPAGNIFIETASLEVSGGARIDSTTTSGGKGGDVRILASEGVSFSGQRNSPVAEEDIFGLGSLLSSGIFARSAGGESCLGPCGNAGNISITTAGPLNITGGASINNGTASTGQGGLITVNAAGNLSISGTVNDGTPGGVFSSTTSTEAGAGAGGTISLTSGQNFTLSDRATVSANSSGPGNAGDITITGHDTILIDKGTVTTDAAQASGGNITLTANDMIQLVDSTIASSVQGEADTAGGDVTLDPDFIILQNSHILAKAVAGQGGNITLIANKAVLLDAQSTLDASSQTGISGAVRIESPIQVLSGTIAPLPDQPVNVATLYASRCVAGEGGHFSTFVDSKSDSVAPTPGTFLASPFLPQVSSSPSGALGDTGTRSVDSGQDSTSSIQLAAYSPPVLFGQGEGMLSVCH